MTIPPYVAVRGQCDLRCAWCNPTGALSEGVRDEVGIIRARLVELRAKGHLEVGFGFSHTEPTTHPDLPRVISSARELGFERILLSTSGIRLAERDYSRVLRDAGLTGVVLTFASLDPLADSLLGRPGATEAKLACLRGCVESGLEPFVIIMFARPLLRGIPEAAARLEELTVGWPGNVHGCLMQPLSNVDVESLGLLWPSFAELAWAMDRTRRRSPRFTLQASDIPPCVAHEIEGVSDPDGAGRASKVPVEWLPECSGCKDRNRCLGVPISYPRGLGGPLDTAPEEPRPTDLPRLNRLLSHLRSTSSGREPSRGDARLHGLAAAVRAARSVASHSITDVLVEPERLRVRARKGEHVLELFVTVDPDARAFMKGRLAGVSYSGSTPLDSDAKLAAARALLALAEGEIAPT